MDIRARVETAALGRVEELLPLAGGQIGQVFKVALSGGQLFVAKVDDGPQPQLNIEGEMLRYLAANSELPVPEVVFSRQDLLIMAFIPGQSHFSPQAEEDAAQHLATLHGVTGPEFGFPFTTLIGAFTQPNAPKGSWLDFFWEQRLWHLAQTAVTMGRLPAAFLPRLEKLSGQLDNWLIEPAQPALIHGDIWRTNVLAQDGRITAFLDPAVYFGVDEVELAYISLFHTFGSAFFRRYEEIRPLAPGFFETRCHLYNLYPLLSHVCHFGGGYVGMVDEVLRQFGF